MPNLFTIPSSQSFVDTLVAGIMKKFGDNLLSLSRITILLPNRRAVKALREAFLRYNQGKPMMLPSMQPIGDIDEEEITIKGGALEDSDPAMSMLEQQLLLTRLVQQWHNHSQAEQQIRIDQALYLAKELASFLFEVEREQLSFDGLKQLVPDNLAAHWQETLDFLKIITEYWPDIIKEQEKLSPACYRNAMLEQQVAIWEKSPPPYPVIAAGSTGSIPATRKVLQTIALMKNGYVVLPGVDTEMDQVEWQQIDPCHPQYMLKQLLEYMDISHRTLLDWHSVSSKPYYEERSYFLREVMCPASAENKWHCMKPITKEALTGISRIDCANLQEEAEAIAIIVRHTLETPGKTTALITHERALAQRVTVLLQQWNIACDISAGIPLNETPTAIFLHQVADMMLSDFSPIAVLSLFKNPFAAIGEETAECRKKARRLEKILFRGVRKGNGVQGLKVALYQEGEAELLVWLEKIEMLCQPFLKQLHQQSVSFPHMLKTHITLAEQLADSIDKSGQERLWQGDKGEQLAAFLEELIVQGRLIGDMPPYSYSNIVRNLLEGQSFRPRYGQHPRVSILSPIEARLQRADVMVLGGLNEGSWPMDVKANPWMSLPMREAFGLPPAAVRVGQSAHDFIGFLYADEVIMTRACKVGGAPTTPSRWLLRMEAVLKSQAQDHSLIPTTLWQEWVSLRHYVDKVTPLSPPSPSPPVISRPRELSVTDIEKLGRDPYGIYAKKILGLKPLDILDADPGAAEFGNFVHKAIELFLKAYQPQHNDILYSILCEAGEKALEEVRATEAVRKFWWPRFERIALWFVENEKACREQGTIVHSELWGHYNFLSKAGNFTIKAKADRLEINNEGNVTIIDYKTGQPPSKIQVRLGVSPQMTLEAVIGTSGGFKDIKPEGEYALAYWQLKGREEAEKPTIFYASETKELIDAAKEGVEKLIVTFDEETTPYLAVPDPDKAPDSKYNEYAHLARIKEWQNS